MTPQEIGILNKMIGRAAKLKQQYKQIGSPWLFTKWQEAERSLKLKKAELKMKYETAPQINISL